jgi:hypothetical protein
MTLSLEEWYGALAVRAWFSEVLENELWDEIEPGLSTDDRVDKTWQAFQRAIARPPAISLRPVIIDERLASAGLLSLTISLTFPDRVIRDEINKALRQARGEYPEPRAPRGRRLAPLNKPFWREFVHQCRDYRILRVFDLKFYSRLHGTDYGYDLIGHWCFPEIDVDKAKDRARDALQRVIPSTLACIDMYEAGRVARNLLNSDTAQE